MADNENARGPHRRRDKEKLIPRKITMTEAEYAQLDALADERGTSVSKLLVSTTLAADAPMDAATGRALAASLMEVRDSLNDLVLALKAEGQQLDPELEERARILTDRLWNMTEDQVRE